MAKKKDGELRLLKDGVIFGPTDRAGLDRLLSAGRVTPEDQVSVRNADWISIADFLAIPAAPPPPSTSEAGPAAAAGPKKAGDLRVVNGGRVTSELTRKDVEQLVAGGRLGEDDLVCALDGPWMRVGDFLSPRVAAAPPRQRWSEDVSKAAPEPAPGGSPGAPPSQPAVPAIPPVRNADPTASPPMVVMAGRVEIVQSKAASATLTEPLSGVGRQPVSPAGVSYRVSSISKEKPGWEDQWYVRIRCMCSAPLGKRHLKALYQSREITAETLARHPKWNENDWRPISSIPELAELSRP